MQTPISANTSRNKANILKFILLSSRHQVSCIRCYNCDSETNPKCTANATTMQLAGVPTVECEGSCRKRDAAVTSVFGDAKKFVRDCVTGDHKDGCIGVNLGFTEGHICYCNVDLCNGQTALVYGLLPMLVCVIVALGGVYNYF
ncbi:hypothetical protein ScPMuIL_015645 [Solemya velum]